MHHLAMQPLRLLLLVGTTPCGTQTAAFFPRHSDKRPDARHSAPLWLFPVAADANYDK